MRGESSYPIILAHGVCRFDALLNVVFDMDNSDDDRFHYFRGIRSALMAHGFQVFHTAVSWAGGVETRAADLRNELIRITRDFTLYPKVHIIAHSMGGLDARHMVCEYGMDQQVASLSTISTPHQGSSFADWGIKNLARVVDLLGSMGLDITGFRDLTTQRCREFNERAQEFELSNGVKYRTYAGVQTRSRVFTPLRFPHWITERAEGENDGLVSLASAKWREDYFVKKIEADHLNEVGWWDVRDRRIRLDPEGFAKRIRDFYLEIARSL